MASRGDPFSQEYSTSDGSKTTFPKDPSLERKFDPKFLYLVSLEVVNDLRKITRSYAKKLGGFPNIPHLPRRQDYRRECPYTKD